MAAEDHRSRYLPEPEPPPLDEELARQEIEQEVRGEYEERYQSEVLDERLMAITALRFWKAVGVFVGIVLGLPLLGLVSGLCVRLFRWASGLW